MAKQSGLVIKQSFEWIGKPALMMSGRDAHARQMKRARRKRKRLHARQRQIGDYDVARTLKRIQAHAALQLYARLVVKRCLQRLVTAITR